jgi:hypothetical protein
MRFFLESLKSICGARNAAAFAAASTLAAVLISGTALAITENVYNYSSPKTGFFGISNLAMAADNSEATNFSNNRNTFLNSRDFNCFNTGVNLPNGATIKNLVVYYSDAVVPLDVTLLRQRLSDGAWEEIAIKAFIDATGTRRAQGVPINESLAQINNTQYVYGFTACLNGNAVFYAARIGYTYTNAGD